jgi:hypothetical protein
MSHSLQPAPSSRIRKVRVLRVDPWDALWSVTFGGIPLAAHTDPKGHFGTSGRAAFFVALRDRAIGDDKVNPAVLGHVAAFIDGRAQPLVLGSGQKVTDYGSFGMIECHEDDVSVLRALLQSAEDWILTQGGQAIIGPMDFSIFHGYRLLSVGSESPQYLGEPRTRPWIRAGLEQCGLSALATWRTYDFSDADHKEQLELLEPIMKVLRPKLEAYHCESIDCSSEEKTQKELENLYPLIMETFADNFAATSIDAAEFFDLYRPLGPLICPSASIRIMHGNDCVGFTLSYRNPLNPGTAVWHSFGNTAAHRGKGLGYLCMEASFAGFVRAGYTASHCSLVKDGGNHFEHTHIAARTYQILGRRIRKAP